jgi:hypothetical protein
VGSINYVIQRSSTAPPDRVFALLSDAPNWGSWFKPAKNVSWEDGAQPPVRLVKLGPGLTVREVVVEETAPTHHAYSIRSVIPIKNHRADVHLTARADGGTDINWVSSCDPKVPGSGLALKLVLSKAVGDLCKALVKAAEA